MLASSVDVQLENTINLLAKLLLSSKNFTKTQQLFGFNSIQNKEIADFS